MRALITNDDGIGSAGLAVLAEVALAAGYDVTVAAPATEYSGASASLLGAQEDGRLVVRPQSAPGAPADIPSYAVSAAPALIAFVAAHGGFGGRPDVVLSGVNRGPNTGNAVIHSGTVGAAFSAITQGVRGIAVSCAAADPEHWGTAGRVAAHGLAWAEQHEPAEGALNINVPDLPLEELRGLRRAPLAGFGAVQATATEQDSGDLLVTYAEIDPSQDPDSDAGLLAAGWATWTVLRAPWYDATAALPDHLDGPPPAHAGPSARGPR